MKSEALGPPGTCAGAAMGAVLAHACMPASTTQPLEASRTSEALAWGYARGGSSSTPQQGNRTRAAAWLFVPSFLPMRVTVLQPSPTFMFVYVYVT